MSRFKNNSRNGVKPTPEHIYTSENKKIYYKDIKINPQFSFFYEPRFPDTEEKPQRVKTITSMW